MKIKVTIGGENGKNIEKEIDLDFLPLDLKPNYPIIFAIHRDSELHKRNCMWPFIPQIGMNICFYIKKNDGSTSCTTEVIRVTYNEREKNFWVELRPVDKDPYFKNLIKDWDKK